MTENSKENMKENMKDALCYIPLVAFILFFIEKNSSDELKKHMKYGMILFGLYFLLSWILPILFLWRFVPLLSLAYIGFSIYLGFKAYNGDKPDIEILDNISEKIEDTMGKK